jgi:hypothetical protein
MRPSRPCDTVQARYPGLLQLFQDGSEVSSMGVGARRTDFVGSTASCRRETMDASAAYL